MLIDVREHGLHSSKKKKKKKGGVIFTWMAKTCVKAPAKV